MRWNVLPLDDAEFATLFDQKALVELLLNEGITVAAEGSFRRSLGTACFLKYQPIARLLLHERADDNAYSAFSDVLKLRR